MKTRIRKIVSASALAIALAATPFAHANPPEIQMGVYVLDDAGSLAQGTKTFVVPALADDDVAEFEVGKYPDLTVHTATVAATSDGNGGWEFRFTYTFAEANTWLVTSESDHPTVATGIRRLGMILKTL
jgi:hypothetical protein